MNLILENSLNVPYYTDMRSVMESLGHPSRNYDWLITDIDGGFWDDDAPQFDDPTIIDGQKLEEILSSYRGQFIWAVFSAFPRGAAIDLSVLPKADGNPRFWQNKPTPEHPNALFEIVCWDSSATLLIGISDDMARQFMSHFPEARDLDRLNANEG